MTGHTLTHHSYPTPARIVAALRVNGTLPKNHPTAGEYATDCARVARRALQELPLADFQAIPTDDVAALAAMTSRLATVPTYDLDPDLARAIRQGTAVQYVVLLTATANRYGAVMVPAYWKQTPRHLSAKTPGPLPASDIPGPSAEDNPPAPVDSEGRPTFHPLTPLARLSEAERELRLMALGH